MLELSPPAESVNDPVTVLVTVPAPAMEPRVSLKPAKSKVAPEAIVMALLFEIRSEAEPSFKVPTLMAVAPV